jgi:Domain of unknown function (DUF4258)
LTFCRVGIRFIFVLPVDVLRIVHEHVARGRMLVYTQHALDRMARRNATRYDVRNALATCTTASASTDGPGRWKMTGGVDLDGDALSVVVALDGGVIVVTLM